MQGNVLLEVAAPGMSAMQTLFNSYKLAMALGVAQTRRWDGAGKRSGTATGLPSAGVDGHLP